MHGARALASAAVVSAALAASGCVALDIADKVGSHRPLTSRDPLDRAVLSAGMAGATLGSVIGVPASMPLLPLTVPVAWAVDDEDVMFAPATMVSATVGVAAGVGAYALTLPLRGARWIGEAFTGDQPEAPAGAPEPVAHVGWIEPQPATPDAQWPPLSDPDFAALGEPAPLGPRPTLSHEEPAPAVVAPPQ